MTAPPSAVLSDGVPASRAAAVRLGASGLRAVGGDPPEQNRPHSSRARTHASTRSAELLELHRSSPQNRPPRVFTR